MIVKLTKEHAAMVNREDIFNHSKHMATVHTDQTEFNDRLYSVFCQTYLMDLNNFHAFGKIENGKVVTFISFYESIEEPSWYYTQCRNIGNPNNIKEVLDKILEYHESNNRFKWYSLLTEKQAIMGSKFFLSKHAIEKYDYIDEYYVGPNQKPYFNQHWEILYRRTLIPINTFVRCVFLRNKYRITLPNVGIL